MPKVNSLTKVIKRLKDDMPFMVGRLRKGGKEHGDKNVDTSLLKIFDELHQETVDVLFYVRELLHLACPPPGNPLRVYIIQNDPYNGDLKNYTQKITEMGHFFYIGGDSYNDLHWLKLCNAALVEDGWEEFPATCDIIELCKKSYDIPVFFNVKELPVVNKKER